MPRPSTPWSRKASARAPRCSARWSNPIWSGLNLTLDIAEVLIADLDRTAGPHPFLREKVKAGKLGMKTGEGLRKWGPGEADEVRERLSQFLVEQVKARKSQRS